jgi:hypothetical protein
MIHSDDTFIDIIPTIPPIGIINKPTIKTPEGGEHTLNSSFTITDVTINKIYDRGIFRRIFCLFRRVYLVTGKSPPVTGKSETANLSI